MYLSKLTLNPTPACRQVLRDLSNPYEMHRTIMRGFPGKAKGGPGRILFRVEPTAPDEPPVVLVQSDKTPDWSDLLARADYLLDAQTKEVRLSLRAGQRLRFRLRANPAVKRDGRRHGLLKEDDQQRWLQRKAEQAGFAPVDFAVRRKDRLHSRKRADGETMAQTHLAVDFEGVLKVNDPDALVKAIAAGIGPAKGFGFGLLSIAPAG